MKYDRNHIHAELVKAANRYAALKSQFDTFSNLVIEQISQENFPIKGVIAAQDLEEGFFQVHFAGRTYTFIFEAQVEEMGDALDGRIVCEMDKYFDEEPHFIGEFKFNAQGETDLQSPENDGDPILLTSDLDAIHLVLHNVYEGLLA